MYLTAFNSTQQALLAEKRLKSTGKAYKIIPTPREIDASCGISIVVDRLDESWLNGMDVRIYAEDEDGKWIELYNHEV
ncbi:MAG: DUF3343 domain-containing protein [Thermoanaerobacteraceae bacterium]|nr:DUF3343 domain-containing protein [Thermoanaerobacteraceae bacterium]